MAKRPGDCKGEFRESAGSRAARTAEGRSLRYHTPMDQNEPIHKAAPQVPDGEGNGPAGEAPSALSDAASAAAPDVQPPQAAEAAAPAALSAPAASTEMAEPASPVGDAPAEEPVRPTIIVMHASVGSGHRSAANAIAQAFEILRDQVGHGDYNVEVLDVLDFGRIVFDGDHAASLFTGFTRPIYDLTWRFSLTGRLLWGGGTIWSRIMYPAFTEHVRQVRPIAIVCTHITAANVAVGARMLSGQEFPLVCVPTDYETEGLWPHRYGDLFCVANESMAETLRPRKVPEERILITGIPTRDDFRAAYDIPQTREKFDLPQDQRVVLALAGAYLPRPYVHFREALDRLLPYIHTLPHMHFVFVTGNDADYARHLRQECTDLGLANVTVLDYVDEMAALMAASDLVICKSGGLTVTECLCAQVPMILLGKAYGQEKVNVTTLTGLGAALHVTTSRELLDALRHIDRNPDSTHAMLINGSFLRRPEAALDIARATFDLVGKPKSPTDPSRRKHFMRLYWGKKPAHIR